MTKLWGTLIAILMLLMAIPEVDAAQLRNNRSFSRPSAMRQSTRPTTRAATRSNRTRKARVSHDKSKTRTSHSRSRDSDGTAKRTKQSVKKDTGKRDSGTRARDDKSSSSAAREARQPLKFDHKPADVAHNPDHRDGSLGEKSEHKSVLVERDGHYFKRSYYSGLGAGVLTWYWYETPLEASDPIVPMAPYAVTCAEGTDDCQVKTRNVDPQIATTWQDMVDWWHGPLKVTPRCDPVMRVIPGKAPAAAIFSCFNAAGSCSGTCQLYNGAGVLIGPSPPTTLTATPAPAGSVIDCRCP